MADLDRQTFKPVRSCNPRPATFYGYGPDATDEEKAQAEREYVEHNRQVHAQLRDLGLLPPVGENLPAHEINEYLRSGGSVDRDE